MGDAPPPFTVTAHGHSRHLCGPNCLYYQGEQAAAAPQPAPQPGYGPEHTARRAELLAGAGTAPIRQHCPGCTCQPAPEFTAALETFMDENDGVLRALADHPARDGLPHPDWLLQTVIDVWADLTGQQIRHTHPDGYRAGEWATIRTVLPARGQPCYLVEFKDGHTDLWRCTDPDEPYEWDPPLRTRPARELPAWERRFITGTGTDGEPGP